MTYVTLSTAVSITGLSKRTLWRRIADKQLHTHLDGEPGEHTRVRVDDVVSISRLRLEPDDRLLILEADAGKAEAQCELALVFLSQHLPTEALHWLKLSAHQNYPEAMHQLGRCHIAGNGVLANETLGVEWISRAAAVGHNSARHMTRYLMDPSRPALTPAALEAKLDAIEQKLVFEVLRETADPA